MFFGLRVQNMFFRASSFSAVNTSQSFIRLGTSSTGTRRGWARESGAVWLLPALSFCARCQQPQLDCVSGIATSFSLDFLRQLYSFGGFFSAVYMWISLERFTECNPQQNFLLIDGPGWFETQSRILSFLPPPDSQCYLRSCVYLIVDTKDLLLTATAIRIHYREPGFSVATPPLQPVLQLAGQGGGGDWDQVFSDHPFDTDSSESDSSHAVEDQDVN